MKKIFIIGLLMAIIGCQKEVEKKADPAVITYKGSVTITDVYRVSYGTRIQKDSMQIGFYDVIKPTHFKIYCGKDQPGKPYWTTGKIVCSYSSTLKNVYLFEFNLPDISTYATDIHMIVYIGSDSLISKTVSINSFIYRP